MSGLDPGFLLEALGFIVAAAIVVIVLILYSGD